MREQDDPFESLRQDPASEEAPSEDLYLRSPAAPSEVDELTLDAGEREDSGLLYDPLEDGGAPRSGPDPADNSSLLFRLALSTAALLVTFVLARGFWWPGEEPRGNPPEWAAAPNLPVAAAPPAAERTPPTRPADPVQIAEPAERTLVEEVASPAPAAPKPAPLAKPRQPEPVVVVEEVAPAPIVPKPERIKLAESKPAEPKPVPVKPAAPKETEKIAALPESAAVSAPALSTQARRIPQPWDEGPQPSDLLKPGPGVEAPVPLAFPRSRNGSTARRQAGAAGR